MCQFSPDCPCDNCRDIVSQLKDCYSTEVKETEDEND